MLLIIFIAITALGVFICIKTEVYDSANTFGFFVAAIGISVSIVSLGIIASRYIAADATVSRMSAERESLVYQAQMNFYDNDNNVGKKELLNQITEWNVDLESSKKLQRNLWVGCYIPNIYDQFEKIPLEITGGA